nr:hypothetical protein [Rhodococcus sp. 15-649-1-2]
MTRIGFADHLFLRMHHGIGNPVFNQFVWRFDGPVAVAELAKLHANLSAGLLSRRVLPPIVPTARHRWVTSNASLPLDYSTNSVPTDAVRCWAEQRISADIDPEAGTGWLLSAAPVADGGTVVSLVCSHMVADGAAMVAAVERASTGVSVGDSARLGEKPSLVDSVASDIADTVGQLRPIATWLAGKSAQAVTSVVRPAADVAPSSSEASIAPDGPSRTDVPETSEPWSPPYVVVSCSASEWASAAAEWGGTSNTLFIAVMTSVSAALGRARPGEELRWSLPYNDRGSTDIESNSTKIIAVRVPVPDPADRDLTRIRKASKTAFQEFSARQASGASTQAVPLNLVQMLPDAVARRLPVPADGAEGLCSNLGRLSEDFVSIGGVRATRVAARATFSGADADFARQLGGGSTAWATETDAAVTISMHGMDPDRMASDEDVRAVVSEVLDRWGIGHEFW